MYRSAVTKECIFIVPYDKKWPQKFQKEKQYLKTILSSNHIRRIEHFGSTSIPGMSAKPIIDILVEVDNLINCKRYIVPILISKGYEYFWRPFIGNEPPYYAWFIKRNHQRNRSHHIHMVEDDSQLWDALLFRDYLRDFSDKAKQYDELKQKLLTKYEKDRVNYTKQKTDFIKKVISEAKFYYR